MMPKSSKVCVIIPARNSEKYIGDSLRSLLSQDTSHIRLIIVVDDGSDSDCIYKAVHDVINNNDTTINIYYFRTPKRNQYAAKNFALSRLNHWIKDNRETIHYVAFQDSDDVATHQRISRQVQVLDDDEDLWAVGCCCKNIKEDGTPQNDYDIAWPLDKNPLLKGQKIFGIGLWNATAMYRREVFDHLGAFDYTPTMGDTEFFIRLVWLCSITNKKMQNIQQSLLYRRIHQQQVSNNAQKSRYRKLYENKLKSDFMFYKSLFNEKLLELNHIYKANPYDNE